MFINSDSVFFDFSKNIENMWLSGMGCTVCRIGNPFWFADGFTTIMLSFQYSAENQQPI